MGSLLCDTLIVEVDVDGSREEVLVLCDTLANGSVGLLVVDFDVDGVRVVGGGGVEGSGMSTKYKMKNETIISEKI